MYFSDSFSQISDRRPKEVKKKPGIAGPNDYMGGVGPNMFEVV